MDVVSCAHKNAQQVAISYHICPDLEFLTNERDAEIWTPLFALCNVVASDRLFRLKADAEELCSAKQSDKQEDATDLSLLRDICEIWLDGKQNMFSFELVQILRNLPEAPWSERAF